MKILRLSVKIISVIQCMHDYAVSIYICRLKANELDLNDSMLVKIRYNQAQGSTH